MDKLKDRIAGNREEFELYELDEGIIWDKIANGLASAKSAQKTLWPIYLWRVAAVLAVFAAIWISYTFLMGADTSRTMALETSPELTEIEGYYLVRISESLQLVKSQLKDDDQYLEELRSLESAYDALRVDLKDNSDSEEVISAMILNYQLRLTILENMLTEIKEKQNEGIGDIVL